MSTVFLTQKIVHSLQTNFIWSSIKPNDVSSKQNCNHINKPQEWQTDYDENDCKYDAQDTSLVDTSHQTVDDPNNVQYWQCKDYFPNQTQIVHPFYKCVHNRPPFLVYVYYIPKIHNNQVFSTYSAKFINIIAKMSKKRNYKQHLL